jgi:signal transduction histidine kinase
MQRRAEILRGRLDWEQGPGTNVILTVPLHK